MRELPEPDSRDGRNDAWFRESVLAIQKQAYEDGLRDAHQAEIFARIDADIEELLAEAESSLPIMLTASQKEQT